MKKTLLILSSIILTIANLGADDHQEVFVGTGKTVEDAKQSAYSAVASEGKPVNSVVSVETQKSGNDNYITVFKIKTQN